MQLERKSMEFDKINYLMSIALDEAHEAYKKNEVPVGCVITNKHGDIIAKSFNTKEMEQNPIHHAEIMAIETAANKLNSWRLLDCNLYVTLEPCPMCMSAIIHARIKNVYFGAYDPKGGAVSLGFNLHHNENLNHKINLSGGFRHRECSQLISNFFKAKRNQYK